MQRAGLLAEEIPSGIMSSSCLRDLIARVGLDRMDEVGKENRVLDEEDGDIVSYDVCKTVRSYAVQLAMASNPPKFPSSV